jgi:hypothetical protein
MVKSYNKRLSTCSPDLALPGAIIVAVETMERTGFAREANGCGLLFSLDPDPAAEHRAVPTST